MNLVTCQHQKESKKLSLYISFGHVHKGEWRMGINISISHTFDVWIIQVRSGME